MMSSAREKSRPKILNNPNARARLEIPDFELSAFEEICFFGIGRRASLNTLEVFISHDLQPPFFRHTPHDTVWIHLALVAIESLQLPREVFPDIDNG